MEVYNQEREMFLQCKQKHCLLYHIQNKQKYGTKIKINNKNLIKRHLKWESTAT
jgi:hypothetical protein